MFKKVTVDIQTVPMDSLDWKIPHGIQLVDPKCYTLNIKDLLVDSDILMVLICNKSSLQDTLCNFE